MKAQIICKTNLYTAARTAGFNPHTGIKVMGEYATIYKANEALSDQMRDLLANDYNIEINSWRDAKKYSGNLRNSFYCGNFGKKRYYEEDGFRYEVRYTNQND